MSHSRKHPSHPSVDELTDELRDLESLKCAIEARQARLGLALDAHVDHITAHASGGPIAAANGQGLCEQCNHATQSGWSPPPSASPPLRRPDPLPPQPLVIELYASPVIVRYAA